MVISLNNLVITRNEGVSLGPWSLNLSAGETLAVMGGNGSGKSTLGQVLAGWHPHLLHASLSGEACVFGTSVSDMPPQLRARDVQLVQQQPLAQLSGCAFSVEEEIVFGPENLGLPEDDILSRLEEALTLTDCQSLRRRAPATLSGGEAQRVVLACALAMRPRLLLLDEAFSRLTPAAIAELWERLRHWQTRYNAAIVTFERAFFPAARHVERILLLPDGTTGSPQAQLQAAARAGVLLPDAWRAGLAVLAPGLVPLDGNALVTALTRESSHA